MIACLNLSPWPLVMLEKQHPGVPVAALGEGQRKVVYANRPALDAGVSVGMRETAALSRCPDLHAEVVSGPTASAAWNELLELLYARYSDRVEGKDGLAFLVVGLPAAQELAAALHAVLAGDGVNPVVLDITDVQQQVLDAVKTLATFDHVTVQIIGRQCTHEVP